MQPPEFPANEEKRLAALRGLGILDTPSEERFDRVTRLAQNVLGVPIAVVSLVDDVRQWFKSRQGLDAAQTPRDVSFCGHTILGDGIFVVPDATKDPRFSDNPLVTGSPDIRFYAGVPLASRDGFKLGTLCVIDRRPRSLSASEADILRDLAAIVEAELSAGIREEETARTLESEQRLRDFLESAGDLIQSVSPDGRILYVNRAWLEATGYSAAEVGTLRMFDLLAPENRAHCAEILGRVLQGEEVRDVETVLLAKDGRRLTLSGNINAGMEAGKPAFTRGFFRDVTAQRRSMRRLAAQNAAIRVLASSESIAQAEAGVLEAVCESLGWRVAAAWRPLEDGGRIACSTYWEGGGKITLASSFRKRTQEIRFEKGKGLPGRVWASGKADWILDVVADPNFPRAAQAADAGLKSGFSFPVVLDGAVEVVFEFFSGDLEPPDEEFLAVMAGLGSQFAEFIRRRRAEGQVRESHRVLSEFQAAVDGSAIVAKTDSNGIITFVNDRFCAISKYPREELVGRTHRVVNSGTHPPEFFKNMWKTISSGKVWQDEVCNRAKDGSLYWVATTITPFLGDDGKPVQYIAIRHDITRRKLAEASLQVATARLQAVLDSATHVSIISTDRDGLISVFNKGAENLLGYTAEEMVGKQNPGIIHLPSEVETRGRTMSLEFGRPIAGFDVFVEYARAGGFDAREWTYVRKDGSQFPVNLTVTALRAGDGSIIGFLGIAVDITDRRRAEAELSRTRDAALELARAKSEFLANMSHEIRTPMNAVIGMTGLLLDTELTAQQKELAETIRGAGDALLAIINDILDFSKAEAGRMTLEEMDFDPRTIAEEAVGLFAGKAQEKGLEIGALIDERIPIRLRGDAGRLRQILSNMVSNAVKFTEKGEVIVQERLLEDKGGRALVRFEVRDTGIGIPEEAKGRLFKAFSQADASTTRKYGGTGLGLAISSKLVEAMGGAIGVDGEPGRGSTFWLELEFPVGTGDVLLVPGEVAGTRVLVVDDNATNREIVLRQTASWRMRAEAVEDGVRALEALRQAAAAGDPFRVCILDMQMPLMDGVEAARRIKADEALAETKVVLLTSMMAPLTPGEMEGVGIKACISKPVRKSSLFDAISNVLSRPGCVVPAPAAKGQSSLASGAWGRLKILVAEDNAINQRVALLQLQKLGCRADVVANGKEALAAAASIPYDIILMDCQMPEMDGFEATRELRRLESDAPRRSVIVAMTANALEGDREKCLSAGMDDYVSKPVRIEDLAGALARWYRPLDPAALAGFLELGDADLIRDLTEQFIEDAGARVAALDIAVKSGDAEGLRRTAHTLKGSSGSLGAKGMQEICGQLEGKARDQDFTAAAPLVAVLGRELVLVAEALRAARPKG